MKALGIWLVITGSLLILSLLARSSVDGFLILVLLFAANLWVVCRIGKGKWDD